MWNIENAYKIQYAVIFTLKWIKNNIKTLIALGQMYYIL